MLREKLPPYTMYQSIFPSNQPMLVVQHKVTVPEDNWEEDGFELKGADFVWEDHHKETLVEIIKEISNNKSIVHTDPTNIAYWIRQHRLDRSIPEESIEKMVQKIKKDRDHKDVKEA